MNERPSTFPFFLSPASPFFLFAPFSSIPVFDLHLQLLGLLPEDVGLVTSEVAVGSGLLEDGFLEFQISLDAPRTEVEGGLDDLQDLLICVPGLVGPVRVDEHGQGVSDTDGVRDLDKAALGESGCNNGLGGPASSVGGRAVDLGGVLSREGTTTVRTPTAIGINDDLAASEAGVSVGASDDEAPRGVQVEDGVVVHQLGRDNRVNDVLAEFGTEVVVGDIWGVLSGDDDGVNSLRDALAVGHLLVLDGNLGLSVRAKEGAGSVLPHVSQTLSKLRGKVVCEGHEGVSLSACITEHMALVSCADLLH
mmetsp:Transcript_48062/g.94926  ORF Transcript_48062/g.94926 Transcript_48062/m.94926 type:complete len:307 (+) Transcript_48062:1372-2292(+)